MVSQERIKPLLIQHLDFVLKNIVVRLDTDTSFMPGGHNGPYLHPETPIRNTCHLVTFISNILSSGDDLQHLKPELDKLVSYLVKDNPYYKSGQYILRGQANDTCNGVIGDAWIIEAFSACLPYVNNDNKQRIESALDEILSRMQFSRDNSYAYRYDYYKKKMSADFTYNHQLWLASALVELKDVKSQHFVESFLDASMSKVFTLRKNGLINHLYHGSSLKNLLNRAMYFRAENKNFQKVDYKERGYHLFNLFAFAKIYTHKRDHKFLSLIKFSIALNYLTQEFLYRLSK